MIYTTMVYIYIQMCRNNRAYTHTLTHVITGTFVPVLETYYTIYIYYIVKYLGCYCATLIQKTERRRTQQRYSNLIMESIL